jgi:hypothetical protein
MATVYAVVYHHVSINYWVEYVFHAIPFISFVLSLVLYKIELKKEERIDYLTKIKKQNDSNSTRK